MLSLRLVIEAAEMVIIDMMVKLLTSKRVSFAFQLSGDMH
jgi:hypothetical protein